MIDYDKLLNSIPKGLNQIETARFLYIELGRYFIYDPEVIQTQDMEKRKEIAFRGIDDIKDNKVVCISLSKIYTELLNRCGINAETVLTPPSDPNNPKDIGHAYTRINIDGKKGSLSLVNDLTNIKVGLKTNHFLITRVTEEMKNEAEQKGLTDVLKNVLTIDEDELRRIDDKIGYTYNGMYLDDAITELKNGLDAIRKEPGFESLSEKDWLAFQFSFIAKNIGHENLRSVERHDYFKTVLNQCIGFDNMESHYHLNGISCFDDKKQMRFFYVLSPLDGSDRIVYTFKDGESISTISQDRIDEMISNGLTTISESNREEYMSILSNGSRPKDMSADIRRIALEPAVMAKMNESSKMFRAITDHTNNKGCVWVHD